MTEYLRQTYVLERVNDTKAIRYVCYEDLQTGKFCVSSGEVLTSPETAEMLSWHSVNQTDQFIKEKTTRWFDTLLEAVEDFAVVTEKLRSS
jgi:hypothetical protein